MTEMQIIKRKILLKRQAIKVIQGEIKDLDFRMTMTLMKADLEARMSKDFDPAISRKLDCVLYILEN